MYNVFVFGKATVTFDSLSKAVTYARIVSSGRGAPTAWLYKHRNNTVPFVNGRVNLKLVRRSVL